MDREINQLNLNWAIKRHKKLLFDNTYWHQIMVNNVWGLDRDVVLKTIMKSCKPAHFIPVHYKSFNNTATFLLKNCSEAIKKLCNRDLLIVNPYNKHNPFKISIRLCYAEGNDFNIDIRQNLINVLNKRFNQETGILNLENFANDPELQEYCALCQPKLFFYVLDLVKRFSFNTLILKDNDIYYLSPMEALQGMRKSLALDLRNNCIEEISELDYFQHLIVTELWLDGNPICDKYSTIIFSKNIKEHVRNLERLDGIQIQSLYEECSGKPTTMNMLGTKNLRPLDSNLKGYNSSLKYKKGKMDSCGSRPYVNLTKAGKKRMKEYLLQGYSMKEAIVLAKNPVNTDLNKGSKRCSTDNSIPSTEAKRAKIKQKNPCSSSTITSRQLNENVRVAILAKNYPEVLLNADQLTGIQSSILEQIVLHKDKGIKPKFLDVTLKQGFLTINCANKDTAMWLKNKVNELESWEGISLMAVNNSKIPRPLILEGLFPNSAQEKNDKIIDFLDAQNESMKVSEWKILSRIVDGDSVKLTFAVDRCWLTNLKKENFVLSYKFGQVNLHTKTYASTSVGGEVAPGEGKNVDCSNSLAITVDAVSAAVVEPSTSKEINDNECDQSQNTGIKTEMDNDGVKEDVNTIEYDQSQNREMNTQIDKEEVQEEKNINFSSSTTVTIDTIVPATIVEPFTLTKANGNECHQSQDEIKIQMCNDGIHEEAVTNECDQSQNRGNEIQMDNEGVQEEANTNECDQHQNGGIETQMDNEEVLEGKNINSSNNTTVTVDAIVPATMVETSTYKEINDNECDQGQDIGNDMVQEEANINECDQIQNRGIETKKDSEGIKEVGNSNECDQSQNKEIATDISNTVEVREINTQIDNEGVQGEADTNEYDRSQNDVIMDQMDNEGVQKETDTNKCGQNQERGIETQIDNESVQEETNTDKCDQAQSDEIGTQMDNELIEEETNTNSFFPKSIQGCSPKRE